MFIASCQSYVDWIFANCLYLPNHFVKVYNTNDSRHIATTISTDFKLLPSNAQGIIYVNTNYFRSNKFTGKEIEFILAHESIHIYNNHVLNARFWFAIEQVLKGNDPYRYLAVEGLKLISALISERKISINAESLMNDECQADELAVKWITHDTPTAIKCLEKLSNYNLFTGSHFWKLFDQKFPVMNYSQRIDELKRRTLLS
jgi:Zn-dependent protease with chaperone function